VVKGRSLLGSKKGKRKSIAGKRFQLIAWHVQLQQTKDERAGGKGRLLIGVEKSRERGEERSLDLDKKKKKTGTTRAARTYHSRSVSKREGKTVKSIKKRERSHVRIIGPLPRQKKVAAPFYDVGTESTPSQDSELRVNCITHTIHVSRKGQTPPPLIDGGDR